MATDQTIWLVEMNVIMTSLASTNWMVWLVDVNEPVSAWCSQWLDGAIGGDECNQDLISLHQSDGVIGGDECDHNLISLHQSDGSIGGCKWGPDHIYLHQLHHLIGGMILQSHNPFDKADTTTNWTVWLVGQVSHTFTICCPPIKLVRSVVANIDLGLWLICLTYVHFTM